MQAPKARAKFLNILHQSSILCIWEKKAAQIVDLFARLKGGAGAPSTPPSLRAWMYIYCIAKTVANICSVIVDVSCKRTPIMLCVNNQQATKVVVKQWRVFQSICVEGQNIILPASTAARAWTPPAASRVAAFRDSTATIVKEVHHHSCESSSLCELLVLMHITRLSSATVE